jgi:hypothetical protein
VALIAKKMVIEEKPLLHWIKNFYGYGSWDARFWFIAHEESGGDLPEEEAEKFNYFYQAHPVDNHPALCNIRDLYQHVAARLDGPRAGLFKTFYDHRFGNNAIQHGLWKNLIAFVHGFESKKMPDQLAYQKTSFLVPAAGSEALMSLFPLPTHNHAWYYSWLDMPQLPFLKSRTRFQEYVYQQRMQTILQNMGIYKPKVVLMYGMNNINMLKASVQQYFPDAKFKMVKATKREIPQHHRANINGTKLLITTQIPALRHNRVETGFDWLELGKMVRSGD